MKILITGVTGFVGKHLANLLITKGFKIYSIVRKASDTRFLDKNEIDYVYNNEQNIISFFEINKFDGIIHLASRFLVNHDLEDIDDIVNTNILFPTKLLELSTKNNVKWFINTGTFWQNYKNEMYNPVNLYSSTKQAFEDISKYYTQVSDINFTTIKLNDTYGFGDTRKKILNLWRDLIKNDNELDMSGGEQLIDLVYIDDVIHAYLILICKLQKDVNINLRNKTFTVSSHNPIKLRELSYIFEKVSNNKLKINWGKLDYRKREIMIPYNNYQPIEGWMPIISLEEGIKKFLGL